MLKAVIFDMDGTVLDTLSDLRTATNVALRKNGLPERGLDEVRRFVGNGILRLVEQAVPAGTPAGTVQNVFDDLNAYYRDHCADETKAYPGIKVMLRALRTAGLRTAVVSNKPDYGVQALVEQYFKGLFDFAVGVTPGVNRKPAPDMVNAALAALGASPETAVYVGDSEVDIATANNAGLPCICVSWGFRDPAVQRAHGATLFANTPVDVLRHVEKMIGADPRDS
ncbi:MAG: HAD-IA family hydrolase [Clostridia bacterium]|nr:HAD-IA family hydrolase [Clostridia bacterium]